MIWKTLLALVLGFFGGWWVCASAGLWYMEKAGIFDRDGGGSMAMFFVIGPFFGAIIAIGLAALTVMRARARQMRLEAGLPAEPVSTRYRALRALLTAFAVYFGAWLLIELFGPYGLHGTARMIVHEGIPAALGFIAGVWMFMRKT